MDYLPSTAHLLERDEQTKQLLMNRINSWQQPSRYIHIIRPATISGNDTSDAKRPVWQTGPSRLICHNRYQDEH